MHQLRYVGRRSSCRGANAFEPRQHRGCVLAGCGRYLDPERIASAFVSKKKVGESASDINSQPVGHVVLSTCAIDAHSGYGVRTCFYSPKNDSESSDSRSSIQPYWERTEASSMQMGPSRRKRLPDLSCPL